MDVGWHLGKTQGGLMARKLPDGTIEWTTPLGQTFRVRPYVYRPGP